MLPKIAVSFHDPRYAIYRPISPSSIVPLPLERRAHQADHDFVRQRAHG